MSSNDLFAYLEQVEKKILAYIATSAVAEYLEPDDIRESVQSYVHRGGKRLRPAVLLMACGCVGGAGREEAAVPAAAGVELFHTWSLVHDDLIDNDALRRGQPTVHTAMTAKAKEAFGIEEPLAGEYGRDIAILAGDMQHAWSLACFADCATRSGVDPAVVLRIITHLESYVIGNLVHGEVLDVQYGMAKGLDIDEDKIVNMLWLKTGVLCGFCGMAGAMIGKNTADVDDAHVRAIEHFTSNCGTAFQLQDDILGLLGDEKAMGKPVGSDIREGKMTVIVHESLNNADDAQKKAIRSVLGNRDASPAQVVEVTSLLQELGGVDRTRNLARAYIEKALPSLDAVEDSRHRRLLLEWADFMIDREV